MKTSITDLRYKMNDVLKALDRNEEVTILYRGKVKGTIIPPGKKDGMKMKEHPFFGMLKDDKTSIQDEMDRLRKQRYHP